jgi:hypothetical protein
MIDTYLDYIQEGKLFSDKTISIDLDKFISGESNKLLIAGLSGGGKTTLCRYFSKQNRAECFETDKCGDFLDALRAKSSYSPTSLPPKEVFHVGYYKCTKPQLMTNKRQIVEGGIVWESYVFFPESRRFLNKFPVIIFGTSSLKSSIQLLKRRKSIGKRNNLEHLYKIYIRNFVQLHKLLKTFRNLRLEVGGEVKEFNIPKLS